MWWGIWCSLLAGWVSIIANPSNFCCDCNMVMLTPKRISFLFLYPSCSICPEPDHPKLVDSNCIVPIGSTYSSRAPESNQRWEKGSSCYEKGPETLCDRGKISKLKMIIQKKKYKEQAETLVITVQGQGYTGYVFNSSLTFRAHFLIICCIIV